MASNISNDKDKNKFEKSISRVSITLNDENKPHHEEIVTKYREYPKSDEPNRNISKVRTSVSLQNIVDSSPSFSINTTNDFDQNSIIQPDKTHLIHESNNRKSILSSKNKSEIDLIDAIGGSWAGSTDPKQLESFLNLKRNADKNDTPEYRNSYSNVLRSTRNKSMNVMSHMVEGSKTVPRKSKLLQENISNGGKKHQENGLSKYFLNTYMHV